MSIFSRYQIAWAMFLDWLKETFNEKPMEFYTKDER